MRQFRWNVIKGQIGKEMVRGLLEDSGYNAYTFGYESLLSQIRYDVQKKRPAESDSIKRLRSIPDLLVYDQHTGRTWFTEVKFRREHSPTYVPLKAEPLTWYQKYWNDSVLIVVVPVEHVFYAQYINKLGELKLSSGIVKGRFDEAFVFDLTKDFLPIENVFPRVNDELMKDYASLFDRLPEMDVIPPELLDYDYEEYESEDIIR